MFKAEMSADATLSEGTIKMEDIPIANAEETKPMSKSRRKVWWIIGITVVLILVLTGVVVATRGGSSTNETDSSKQQTVNQDAEEEDGNVDGTDVNDDCVVTSTEDLTGERFLQDRDFWSIGCFLRQASADAHSLSDGSPAEKAEECHGLCVTRHFGVAENTCYCYVDAPQQRLAIGSCVTVCGTPVAQRMEAYFDIEGDTECNQSASASVRNFLVEEDDVPFGFDLIRNTYRQSPFELFKDECGTNMYEVQTEASENSNTLSTSVQSVEEFAQERRSSRSASISTSASVSYKSLFVKVSGKVSASFDSEQNAVFASSGATNQGSRVYTSTGVKRLAEVKLVDFENRQHFVTFNEQFANLLRAYRDGGYSKDKADEIIAKYGQLVVSRGIFGGYVQLRSTLSSNEVETFFSSEEDSRRCYEAAVSGKASGFGFKGSFQVGTSGCSENAASVMASSQNSFAAETSSQSVVGGKLQDGELVVTPELSTLLTNRDKYPTNDNGIQLRLLSDFLAPDKISPLEVRRYQITETEFSTIQEKLQAHILDYLQDTQEVLEKCGGGCPLSYLEVIDGTLQCQCYDPQTACGDGFETNGDSCVPSFLHVPNTYCQYYAQGGDGPCEDGKPFDEIWQRCVDDGRNKCMGVMWNSCTGPTANISNNGAWKLMNAGQNVGDANNPTATCGGAQQALGHWDVFLRT